MEGKGGTYLSPRGVRNLNKYLAQACQNRGEGGDKHGSMRSPHTWRWAGIKVYYMEIEGGASAKVARQFK